MYEIGLQYERGVAIWKEKDFDGGVLKDTGKVLLEFESFRTIELTKNEAYIIGQELIRLGR